MGEVRVLTLYSNVVGTYSQWTRTGDTTSGNDTAVNEMTFDLNTSYNASSTVGRLDTYNYQTTPSAAPSARSR